MRLVFELIPSAPRFRVLKLRFSESCSRIRQNSGVLRLTRRTEFWRMGTGIPLRQFTDVDVLEPEGIAVILQVDRPLRLFEFPVELVND